MNANSSVGFRLWGDVQLLGRRSWPGQVHSKFQTLSIRCSDVNIEEFQIFGGSATEDLVVQCVEFSLASFLFFILP